MELSHDALAGIYRDIGASLKVLEDELGLSLSIHTPYTYTNAFMNTVGWVNVHHSKYCKMIKSDPILWQKCTCFQRAVRGHFACEGCGEGYFGLCCFGVGEFVLPINSMGDHDISGKPIGFISVSGYSPDKAQTRRIAERIFERTGCRPKGYDEALDSLCTTLPDTEQLKALLKPFADLFGMIYIRTPRHTVTSDYSYHALLMYISQNYDEPITVASAAKLIGCSESYINHLFKKKSGKSIRAYINEVRIMHAKTLLRTSNKPIRDIALSVGFNDTNYFASVFRTFTQKTPSEYRKECRLESRNI